MIIPIIKLYKPILKKLKRIIVINFKDIPIILFFIIILALSIACNILSKAISK